jgi:hypothetical protein
MRGKSGLKAVSLLCIFLLSGCVTRFSQSTFTTNCQDVIEAGGLTILPLSIQTVEIDNPEMLKKDQAVNLVQEALKKVISKRYLNVEIVEPEELLKRIGTADFDDIYEKKCDRSRSCLVDSIENAVKTKTCLLVEEVMLTKCNNPCEFFACLIGTRYSATLKAVILDKESKMVVAELKGNAYGHSGLIIYLLPPLILPQIATLQGTIKSACEAAFSLKND